MSNLLVFGLGYSASACVQKAGDRYESIAATTRSHEKAESIRQSGMHPVLFDGDVSAELESVIQAASHLLISIAPEDNGDPVLNACGELLLQAPDLRWACYLSTVGVYGDHGGEWVDEETVCRPVSKRSRQRLAAEQGWRELAAEKNIPLAIFRLSGIYGPGRNAFVNIEKGRSRRLVKPGQVFNRIHRDDIAAAFDAACDLEADGIFNITDDEPAPPQDVVAFAHQLHGSEPPPETDFGTADLSPMARSFYGENKRVSNAKSKQMLGMDYIYPDYRTALTRLWADGSWRGDN